MGESSRHMNADCKTCPAGTESMGSGARQCYTCSAGYYAPEGSSYCSSCDSGTYAGAGAESCTPCPEPGWSVPLSKSIEECYVGTGVNFEDETGTYNFSQTCFWTND